MSKSLNLPFTISPKVVVNLAQNPELISQYPQIETRDEQYQLLIITPSQFQQSFETLTDLYLIRGIETEIITTEFIESSVTGQDLQEKIRNYSNSYNI